MVLFIGSLFEYFFRDVLSFEISLRDYAPCTIMNMIWRYILLNFLIYCS